MSDCCNNQEADKKNCDGISIPRKLNCPVNDQLYLAVDKKTILQHIKSPWNKALNEDKYYFCDDAECDVVYFGLNGSLIYKSELRTVIGKKEQDEEALVCYCFGVSKSLAAENPDIKNYVTQQTKERMCACDIRNPSGKCCLKDFPKKH